MTLPTPHPAGMLVLSGPSPPGCSAKSPLVVRTASFGLLERFVAVLGRLGSSHPSLAYSLFGSDSGSGRPNFGSKP